MFSKHIRFVSFILHPRAVSQKCTERCCFSHCKVSDSGLTKQQGNVLSAFCLVFTKKTPEMTYEFHLPVIDQHSEFTAG
jgi:hypothetical protein